MVSWSYHGMEASAIIVGGDEDVIGALGPVPKRVVRGDKLDSGGYERASVANGREPVNGAKVAGYINGYKVEVRFIWVKCSYVAV